MLGRIRTLHKAASRYRTNLPPIQIKNKHQLAQLFKHLHYERGNHLTLPVMHRTLRQQHPLRLEPIQEAEVDAGFKDCPSNLLRSLHLIVLQLERQLTDWAHLASQLHIRNVYQETTTLLLENHQRTQLNNQHCKTSHQSRRQQYQKTKCGQPPHRDLIFLDIRNNRNLQLLRLSLKMMTYQQHQQFSLQMWLSPLQYKHLSLQLTK